MPRSLDPTGMYSVVPCSVTTSAHTVAYRLAHCTSASSGQ